METDKTLKSLEDELFDLLDTPTPSVVDPNKVILTNADPVSKNLETEEFLSWLEESPKAPESKSLIEIGAQDNNNQTQFSVLDSIDDFLSSATNDPRAPEPIIPNQALQPSSNFFDEVFGDEINKSSNPLQIEKKETASCPNIEDIINSPFPDVGKLRQVIDESGSIPSNLRLKIMLLFLTGSWNEDDEADKFILSENEKQFYSVIYTDCQNLLKSSELINGEIIIDQIANTIILFLQRRNIEYKNIYSRIMLSLISGQETVKRSLLSSCFYSLSTNFLPLIGLQLAPFELALEGLHTWLRLLVTYHSPLLAQHLDRVIPGWEKCSKEFSSSQTAKYNGIIKGTNNLDDLERQLGIDMGYDFDFDSTDKPSDQIESANPKQMPKNGVISSHWILSYFSGCMPPEHSSKLLDWSVFNGERFAGIYFIASLLEIYSSSLLKMNAIHLRQWFDDISGNKKDWFKQTKTISWFDQSTDLEEMSWSQFVYGWIKATGTLINNTPVAFRETLNRTETWAMISSEKQQKELFSKMYSSNTDNLDDSNHGDIYDEDDEDSDEEDSEDDSDINQGSKDDHIKLKPTPSVPGTVNFLDHLKSLTSKFQLLNSNQDDSMQLENDDFVFIQDKKLSSETVCLWVDSNELVPCVCSNQRRSQNSIFQIYDSFIQSINNTSKVFEKTTFFISKTGQENPFYFGIDCRTSEEKTIGLFPKAFCLDPEIITDSDALQDLLNTLDPIASSTHITIIGAGEHYYRWYYKQLYPRKKFKKDPPELLQMIADSESRTKALVMFLLKKPFKHISILEGGFYDALMYMNRPDSKFNVSSSLVDADRERINSILGIPSNPVIKPTLTASIIENAPNAIKSVGSLLSNAFQSKTTVSVDSIPSEKDSSITQNDSSSLPPSDLDNTKNTVAATKQLLSGWGKNLSILGSNSLETLKKGINNINSNINANLNTKPSNDAPNTTRPLTDNIQSSSSMNPSNFVIDDEDDDFPGDRKLETNSKISITRTENERAQALAMHRMAGLKKGDQISISRTELPGAVLFPCTKSKIIQVPAQSNEESSEQSSEQLENVEITVSRYLVVSRERFIVLDSKGGGVGAPATVKSNRHLTELLKMTFKKKDPSLVTLHFVVGDGDSKRNNYRVAKYQDFVSTLQKNMERFNS